MEQKPEHREAFAEALYPLYHCAGLLSRWEGDLTYLRRAYDRTEELYQANFARMSTVRLVILAEAPLFGSGEVYIYNPEARHTSFLWPSDLADIAGRDTSTLPKAEYLALLRQLGILVVDIFPYALNNDDTGRVYKKKKGSAAVELTFSQKEGLAEAVEDFHFRPKLEQIAAKGDRSARFCARYVPVGRIARDRYPELLDELGFASSGFVPISMQGGMIDKDRFKEEYDAATGGA